MVDEPRDHASDQEGVHSTSGGDEATVEEGAVRPEEPEAAVPPAGTASPSLDTGTPSDVEAPPAPRPRPQRLMRSRVHRVIGGVAGGIADRTDTDPGLIRVLFIVLALVTAGLAAVLYVVLWISMPLEPPGAAAGAEPGREAPAGDRRGAGIFLGLVLVAAGLVWLLEATDAVEVEWPVVLAVTLIVIGALLVLTLGSVARAGLITLGIVVAIALVAVSAVDVNFDSSFGNRRETPATIAELEPEYSHSFGSMTLDLSRLPFPEGTTTVKASTAFGSLQVILPASGVSVRIDAETTFGSVDALDDEVNGARGSRVRTDAGYDTASRRLDLEVDAAFGSVEVRR